MSTFCSACSLMTFDYLSCQKLAERICIFFGALLAAGSSVCGEASDENEARVFRLDPAEIVVAKPVFAGRWQDFSSIRPLNTPDTVSVTTIPGEVISEATVQLGAIPLGSGSSLQFNFGFSTQESRTQQTFSDSVTLTLSAGANGPLYILTADVNGPIWSPNTPGTFEFDPSLIQRTPTSGANNPFPTGFNYFVSVPVPAQFEGLSLTLTLGLLNNQDQFVSLASLDKIAVAVPEPAVRSLLILCSLTLLATAKRRHNS